MLLFLSVVLMVNLNLSSVYTPDLFVRSYLKSVAYGTNADLNLITLSTELCIVNAAIKFGTRLH